MRKPGKWRHGHKGLHIWWIFPDHKIQAEGPIQQNRRTGECASGGLIKRKNNISILYMPWTRCAYDLWTVRPATTLTQFELFKLHNALGASIGNNTHQWSNKNNVNNQYWCRASDDCVDNRPCRCCSPDNYAHKSVRVLIGLLITNNQSVACPGIESGSEAWGPVISHWACALVCTCLSYSICGISQIAATATITPITRQQQ